MRVTSGANAWKKAEGVKGNIHITRKRKGNVLSLCVIPAFVNAQDTMPLTETEQETVKVSENILVRNILRDRRRDKRSMDELREEVGAKELLENQLVRISLT